MPIDGGAAAKLVRKTVKENGEALETKIIKDEILKGDTSSKVFPDNLRLVTDIAVSGKGNNIKRRIMSFLTNNMTRSSVTIANLYPARWQIEAFFKLTKQNLRLDEFLGAGRDAVKTQIYIALTALLLLRYWQATSKEHWSLRQMLAVIRSLLREHRGLRAWTDRATPSRGDRKKADNMDGPDGRPPCKPPNLFAGK
jgi:IS4 transposase